MLLIADIGLMSGIASYRQGVIPKITNDDVNDPEGHLLLYGLVILPLIAFGIIIVIAMITLPLLTRPVNRIQTLSLKRPRWTLRQRHDKDRDGHF